MHQNTEIFFFTRKRTVPVHLFSIKSVTGITHSGLPRYPAMLSKTHSLSSAMLVTPNGVVLHWWSSNPRLHRSSRYRLNKPFICYNSESKQSHTPLFGHLKSWGTEKCAFMKFRLPGWMTHNLYPWQLDVRAFPEKFLPQHSAVHEISSIKVYGIPFYCLWGYPTSRWSVFVSGAQFGKR